MTTTTLTLSIITVVLLQLFGFSLLGLWRSRMAFHRQDEEGQKFQPSTVAIGSDEPSALSGWSGFKEFRVERKVYENLDRSICSLYLKPVDGVPLSMFRPGQFLTFRLEIVNPATGDAEQLIRCYSLSDAPGRDTYRVSIKRVAAPADRPELSAGRSSSYFHDQVEAGDRLAVRAPSGHFFLQPDEPLPVVLIAGGIGITPMLSMLTHLLEGGSKREVWLFYGVRNGDEVAMAGLLRKLAESHSNFHFHLSYSAPLDSDREGVDFQHAGRIDLQLLRNTLPLQRHQFYVCGPRPMMESLVPGLEEWGVALADIFYESFGPASLIRPRQTAPAEGSASTPLITFSQSGRQVTWDPAVGSLLEFAEANAIEVTYGCRAGSCGACQTRLSDGEIEYSQHPDADLEPGHCLLCISRPKGNITLEA
ncbi:MAG: 2Fe-2S iron-sulfur cluster binding domain-containing protein [Gammaproteobacteria bacterium]|nr:2Fe-2S iron-sulfur cluster binding domain-containing protein [Gammaproteobacteria bacterium]